MGVNLNEGVVVEARLLKANRLKPPAPAHSSTDDNNIGALLSDAPTSGCRATVLPCQQLSDVLTMF